MKYPIRLSTAVALLACGASYALPAFPGAQGYGAETKGGRGGKVYVVTTLASSGPGSFNEAWLATGPRTIVFRVSGVIDLQPDGNVQREYLLEKHSNVTIAGQTSPGGITLVSGGGGTSIVFAYQSKFHDGIFRFLRFRGGKHNEDAFTMNGGNNFIFDHVDFSGGRDETLDITASNDFTVQWCTITNSSEGQTYGMLMAYLPTAHVSLHHNLFAHHVERFPEMHWSGGSPPDNGKIDLRNNVCYNASKYYLYASEETPAASVHMNVVGNYYKAGPQTTDIAWFPKMVFLNTKITAHGADNMMATKEGVENLTAVPLRIPNPASAPFQMPAVTTFSAKEAYDRVLDRAGAWPRDAMMVRTVAEVRAGTGQHKKDDDAKITGGPQPPADADLDGMPDKWETAMGLDPNSQADNVLDKDNDGYTNIEEYINDEAANMLGEALQNPDARGGLVRVAPRHGAGRGGLSARMDGADGSIRIRLPQAATRRGEVLIEDVSGRVLAAMPAAPEMAWKPQGPAGVYSVRWIVDGRTAGIAAVGAP